MKRKLILSSICVFMILLAVGCGRKNSASGNKGGIFGGGKKEDINIDHSLCGVANHFISNGGVPASLSSINAYNG